MVAAKKGEHNCGERLEKRSANRAQKEAIDWPWQHDQRLDILDKKLPAGSERKYVKETWKRWSIAGEKYLFSLAKTDIWEMKMNDLYRRSTSKKSPILGQFQIKILKYHFWRHVFCIYLQPAIISFDNILHHILSHTSQFAKRGLKLCTCQVWFQTRLLCSLLFILGHWRFSNLAIYKF